jgi:hypothetical protein
VPIQLPYTGVTTTETIPAPFTNGGAVVDLTQKEDKPNKGVANGYAPLDANAKVPTANLPANVNADWTATSGDAQILNKPNSFAPSAHSHTIEDVDDLHAALEAAVQTTDARLSDNRAPTSHAHGNITNAGAVGSTADLPLITTTNGAITTGFFGQVVGSFSRGNHGHGNLDVGGRIPFITSAVASVTPAVAGSFDSVENGFYQVLQSGNTSAQVLIMGEVANPNNPRLIGVNIPGSGYTAGLATVNGIAVNIVIGSVFAAGKPLITGDNGLVTAGSFGTTANSFCAGNDSRLSDSRTPTEHTHAISQVTSLQATLTAFAIALG